MTTKRKKRLTAKAKFNIFLKTRPGNAPVGEILREYGIHLADLRKIEEAVEVANLKKSSKSKRNFAEITVADYKALKQELEIKEKALADLSVEFMI